MIAISAQFPASPSNFLVKPTNFPVQPLVAGEIEYDEDGNHEKEKLLGERLVSIAVQRGNVHDVMLSMLGH